MATQPEPAASAPMSELSRLTGVFLEPGRAFSDIAARPRWWMPVVLLTALSLVYLFAYSRHIGWERFMRQTIESNSRTQNLPAEQRERIIQQQTRVVSSFSYVGAVAGTVIAALVVGGIMLFVFNLLLAAQLRFVQAFAITCYAMLPGLINHSLAILVMFLKNPEDFNLQNPTAFNIGAFLDPQSTPKWMVSLGSSFDLFSFWTLALLAVGFSAASRKIAFPKALAGVLAPWALYVCVKAGWAALFS